MILNSRLWTKDIWKAKMLEYTKGDYMKKHAFTLAEVLITLGIIGVVAAITLPALMTNIQDRVKSSRVQNIKQKFSKATDKMLSVSGMNGYDSTEAFVNELQNHLKLAKICDNNHLNECWPTENVILDDTGKEWDITETKTGKTLKMKNDDYHEWDDTMGIITADGTAMILSYNKKCDIDTSKPVKWTADNSTSTGCIAAVFDWNGAKKPNKLSNDVIAFNAGGLGNRCAFELGGKCFMAPKVLSELSRGPEIECGGADKIASPADIALIAKEIYGTPIGKYEDKDDITANSSIATSMGFPDPKTSIFSIWTNEDWGDGCHVNIGFNSSSTWTYHDAYPNNSLVLVVCLGD